MTHWELANAVEDVIWSCGEFRQLFQGNLLVRQELERVKPLLRVKTFSLGSWGEKSKEEVSGGGRDTGG
jgi:hypothetical protein